MKQVERNQFSFLKWKWTPFSDTNETITWDSIVFWTRAKVKTNDAEKIDQPELYSNWEHYSAGPSVRSSGQSPEHVAARPADFTHQ